MTTFVDRVTLHASAGAGGDGSTSSITGTSTYYAGGGGGRPAGPNPNVSGGAGGGGYYGGGAGSYGANGMMAGGGGGSGYVHSSVIMGGTFTGARDMPAMFWDEDLPKYKSTHNEFAVGGDYCNPGGDGFICIYY